MKLISRNVVTCWNLIYDILCFVLKHQKPVDAVMADKNLRLYKFELDKEKWNIIEDLVNILEM